MDSKEFFATKGDDGSEIYFRYTAVNLINIPSRFTSKEPNICAVIVGAVTLTVPRITAERLKREMQIEKQLEEPRTGAGSLD